MMVNHSPFQQLYYSERIQCRRRHCQQHRTTTIRESMQYLLLDHGDYLQHLRALASMPYSSELSLNTCGFFSFAEFSQSGLSNLK